MQTKIIKITAILLSLSLFFLVLYFMLRKKGAQLEIKTSAGNISINSPYAVPDAKPLSLNGVNFKNNPNYSIDYYPDNQGFLIAILNTDIQSARNMAERDLLTTLGVSKKDACKLVVSLGVPFDVSEKASGTNYGLSFCPNGKAFPK